MSGPRSEPTRRDDTPDADPRATVWPREELTTYERWELPQVGEDGARPPAGLSHGPLTASQLEEVQRQAYEEAYALGRTEGHREGLAEGQARARKEAASVLEALNEGLRRLARPFAELDHEVETALVTLAVAVARQLLLEALEERPERVLAAVRAGMDALPSAERSVRLELHPEDLPIVRDGLASGGVTGIELRANPALTRGGCRIESNASRIDATVEARLDSVIAHVLGGARETDAGAEDRRGEDGS
jgi:flagellar assembly protein FliH